MRHSEHRLNMLWFLSALAFVLLLFTVRTCYPNRLGFLRRVFSTSPDGAAAQVFAAISDGVQNGRGVQEVFAYASEILTDEKD